MKPRVQKPRVISRCPWCNKEGAISTYHVSEAHGIRLVDYMSIGGRKYRRCRICAVRLDDAQASVEHVYSVHADMWTKQERSADRKLASQPPAPSDFKDRLGQITTFCVDVDEEPTAVTEPTALEEPPALTSEFLNWLCSRLVKAERERDRLSAMLQAFRADSLSVEFRHVYNDYLTGR